MITQSLVQQGSTELRIYGTTERRKHGVMEKSKFFYVFASWKHLHPLDVFWCRQEAGVSLLTTRFMTIAEQGHDSAKLSRSIFSVFFQSSTSRICPQAYAASRLAGTLKCLIHSQGICPQAYAASRLAGTLKFPILREGIRRFARRPKGKSTAQMLLSKYNITDYTKRR